MRKFERTGRGRERQLWVWDKTHKAWRYYDTYPTLTQAKRAWKSLKKGVA